eukprot:CAMPEP_0194530974 /NCGR_PEP_ID=MMETSP0253-20130528/68140_1 /TAXON_ID=2966 /ORGANISM="Noctiluca scintillans" /LENGTH=102 /DNA_ID=CAMNT_0039376281 /DNA_START=132 /DNA_END=437 /DNA_ORIENTATION=+
MAGPLAQARRFEVSPVCSPSRPSLLAKEDPEHPRAPVQPVPTGVLVAPQVSCTCWATHRTFPGDRHSLDPVFHKTTQNRATPIHRPSPLPWATPTRNCQDGK